MLCVNKYIFSCYHNITNNIKINARATDCSVKQPHGLGSLVCRRHCLCIGLHNCLGFTTHLLGTGAVLHSYAIVQLRLLRKRPRPFPKSLGKFSIFTFPPKHLLSTYSKLLTPYKNINRKQNGFRPKLIYRYRGTLQWCFCEHFKRLTYVKIHLVHSSKSYATYYFFINFVFV